MNQSNHIHRGVFKACVKDIRKKSGRYYIFLKLQELNKSINIDIHDSISETLGTFSINKSLIEKMLVSFPTTITVSNLNGYWKIENEYSLFSDVISKII